MEIIKIYNKIKFKINKSNKKKIKNWENKKNSKLKIKKLF